MKRFICFLIGHAWTGPFYAYGDYCVVCPRCNISMRVEVEDLPPHTIPEFGSEK